jgi:hypothetical protein
MAPSEAKWVQDNVWPPAFHKVEAAYPLGYFNRCPCQGSMCGACDGTSDRGRPRHDRCLSRQHGHPIVSPLARLTDGHFMVCGPALWPANGPACRYICPCPCSKTGPVERPARRRPVNTAKPSPAPVRSKPGASAPTGPDVLAGHDALFGAEL